MESYPLQWPIGWKRTEKPIQSRFRRSRRPLTIFESTVELLSELKLFMGLRNITAEDVIISTNLKYKRNGLPYSNQSEPKDAGVAVYFKYNGEDVVIPNDNYDKIADNIYAIARTIFAMRMIERDGGSEILSKAFTGFKQLPESGSGESWWSILSVNENASIEEIRESFRRLAQIYHPDKPGTGDANMFHKIKVAYEQALKTKS